MTPTQKGSTHYFISCVIITQDNYSVTRVPLLLYIMTKRTPLSSYFWNKGVIQDESDFVQSDSFSEVGSKDSSLECEESL